MNIREKFQKILIWSQKYTQTDMIYLAKGGFWLVSEQIIVIIFSFLLAWVLANFLPRETYGSYRYILSFVGILAIFTLPGMNTAIVQASARGYEGSLIPALKTKIRFGMITSLLSFGIAIYYFLHKNSILAISFLIAALFVPLMASFGIFTGYLKGKELFNVLFKYTAIIQLIYTGCLITVLFLTNNLLLVILTYFVSQTILYFIFMKKTIKNFPQNQKKDPHTLSFGKHLTLMQAVNLIASQLDKLLLWHFLGPVQLAIYSFAILVPQKINGLLSGVIRPLSLPRLSKRNPEDLKNVLPKKAFKLFLILLPLFGAYLILAPFLYKIFFPKYLDSAFYSQIFAFSFLLIPGWLFRISLTAQMKTRELYVSGVFFPIVKIIALTVLIPLYGLIGAITAILIGEICLTSLLVFLFKRM